MKDRYNWNCRPCDTPSLSKLAGGDAYFGFKDEWLGNFVSAFVGGYSALNMLTLFECVPEVFAPVDAIARRVANATFQLKKVRNDEAVYDNKEWNALFESPNWTQTWYDYVYSYVAYKYLCGNSYSYANVPGRMPVEMANVRGLWQLPPQYTEIITKEGRVKLFASTEAKDIIKFYRVANIVDDGEYDPSRVEHDTFLRLKHVERSYQTGDFLKGVSPLISCEKPISNLIAVYEARNVIYTKRGALGLLVSKKSDESGLIALTKKEKEEALKDFHGTYGIQHGKSPVGITAYPLEFVRTAMSIQELEPFTETLSSAAAIYACLGVPRALMPKEKGETFSNNDTDIKTFYQDVIIPVANQFCLIHNRLLRLSEKKLYLCASFDDISALQPDKQKEATTFYTNERAWQDLFKNNHVTRNQLLVALGQEEIDGPEGDKYYRDEQPEEEPATDSAQTQQAGA